VGADRQASPDGRGGAGETPVGPDRVYLGDYVTVDRRHEAKRLVALKITVPTPPAGNGGARDPAMIGSRRHTRRSFPRAPP
jgi:hypothetical protein